MTDKYNSWTKEELIKEVSELRRRQKFGLVWEDKDEEEVKRLNRELPILVEDYKKQICSNKSHQDNIIIEGDNFHSLSLLNYTHRNSIDFIYADPPYNTGSKDWRYNNDFVDSEDPYRHTKWISFMSRRLKLAKELLKDDGIICVTIDDYELPRLWLLMEQIFGESNHLGTVVIRNNPKGRMTKRKFSLTHEYALFFGKTLNSRIKRIPQNPEDKSHNYKKDKDGEWYLPTNLRKQGVDSQGKISNNKFHHRYFPIYYHPKENLMSLENKKGFVEILPVDSKGLKRRWKTSKEELIEKFNSGEIFVKENKKTGWQIYYKFRGGLDGRLPQSIWINSEFSASDYGTKILDNILEERELFQYPKAPEAVKECINSALDKKEGVILDFFAGSGTTAQAVLELNEQDNGDRKFILCTNNENKIAEDVCYKRVKNIIQGYTDFKGKKISKYDVNLKYYKIDFLNRDITDSYKLLLAKKSVDLIHIKEGAYKKSFSHEDFIILEGENNNVAIIFEILSIEKIKEVIKNSHKNFSVYVFSLCEEDFADDFYELNNVKKVTSFPEPFIKNFESIL